MLNGKVEERPQSKSHRESDYKYIKVTDTVIEVYQQDVRWPWWHHRAPESTASTTKLRVLPTDVHDVITDDEKGIQIVFLSIHLLIQSCVTSYFSCFHEPHQEWRWMKQLRNLLLTLPSRHVLTLLLVSSPSHS